MPTLELPNLAAYSWQKQTTPPPIAVPGAPIPAPNAQSSPGCPPPSSCQTSYNLTVEQGATLSSQITIQVTDVNGNLGPVNLTGFQFQFTAKPDPNLPDSDPSTVTVDWQETTTPTQGITHLVVPASVTQTMQVIAYYYQIRMVSPSAVVSPLVTGTITVTQPISSRF